MKEQLTAVFQKVPEGYIAFVEELPGANGRATPSSRRDLISKKRFSWSWKQTVHSAKKHCSTSRLYENPSLKFHEAGRSDPPFRKARCPVLTRGR